MQKFIDIILILFIIGIYSCSDENKSITESDTVPLLVFLTGSYVPGYFDHWGYVPFEQDKFRISGQIIAEQIVKPEYLQFGDSLYDAGDIDFVTGPGSVSFQKFIDRIEHNENYLELKTSGGTISGTMIVPDTVSDISFNVENINYHTEFSVSWDCDFATVYNVDYYIQESQFPGYSLHKDTTIATASINILLGSSYYANKYFHIQIQPVNRPQLEPGSGGNMHGDGSGFISCYGTVGAAKKLVQSN